jgi:hypothetical protein
MKCGKEKTCLKKTLGELRKLKKDISEQTPIYLKQSDFSGGTYIINQPGYYVLSEDILFNPNPEADYFPKPEQEKYQTLGYSLGFFAVIAIAAQNVYLDLNGHQISASLEFTLQQRFFSIIELGDAPFLKGQGPGSFSNGLTTAKDTIIGNGTLGFSSHHGIHGNIAENILLEDLVIKDFEFVGIALNGSHCLALDNVQIGPNRDNIPVLATYSAARFNRLFAKNLLTDERVSPSFKTELSQALANLEEEMRVTFNEVIAGQKVSSELFRNESGLADGNVYGILIKDRGVAINDFTPSSNQQTRNVVLHKVNIKELKGRVDEIVALSNSRGRGACVDIAGAVFPIDFLISEGKYNGTNLSDLQIKIAEICNNLNIKMGTLNIPGEVVSWCKNGTDIQNLINQGFRYKCGGDSMHHFNKGILGIRLDALDNVKIKKCQIENISNFGRIGNTDADGSYLRSFDGANRDGYFGADTCGIHLSFCTNIEVIKSDIVSIYSENGDSIGINLIHKTSVDLEKSEIKDIKAGRLKCGFWTGTDYWGEKSRYREEMPNRVPKAIGIRVEESQVEIDDVEIFDLCSPSKPKKILYV